METKELATFLKGPVEKILTKIGEELKQVFSNRLLEYQTEEYKRNYFSKTLLHRSEPKALNEFYQPLSITKYESKSRTKTPTDSAKKLFAKNKYITLIGSAGSGKSTIVKYLFVNCVKENYKIPIKVELRYLNDYKGNLNDYIFNEIFKFQKLGVSPNIIDRLIGGNDFIFFFDGYDEINSSIKSEITRNIDEFVKKYPDNKYLITSRPYTSIDLLPLFSNFSVCDLEIGEIASFVKKQIPKEEVELAEKIIKAINKTENRSYRTFLSNPLLLSMFILTFQSYSDIPQKRSEFYKQVFDTLFSVHDSMSKLAYVREKISGLNKEDFEDVLRMFCFISFFEEKFIYTSNYLDEKLTLLKSKKPTYKFDNDKFVDDLQVAIGILNKEGLDYTFPHRSLQEYFAASYIERLGVENKINLYERIRKEIIKSPILLLNRDHFYSLLSEIDYSHISMNLSIPILSETYKELITYKGKNDLFHYRIYAVITLVFHILLKTSNKHKEIHDEFFVSEIPIFLAYIDDKYINSVRTQRLAEHEKDNLALVMERVQYFQSCGQSIISKIKQNIEDIDKSDQAIINLI